MENRRNNPMVDFLMQVQEDMETANKESKAEKMNKCDHKKVNRIPDVGFDIDEDGEEKQHIEECELCGARRLVYEYLPFTPEKKPHNHYGKWETDGFLFSLYL